MISSEVVNKGLWKTYATSVNIGSFKTAENDDGEIATKKIKLRIRGMRNDKEHVLFPLEVPQLTGEICQPGLPQWIVNTVKSFQPLADPQALSTNSQTLPFQLIIGNNVANAVYKDVKYKFTPQFVIKDTVFGYVFSGPTPTHSPQHKKILSAFTLHSNRATQMIKVLNAVSTSKTELEREISSIVRYFYEQELLGLQQGDQTQEQADQLILESFQNNLTRKQDGRYVIKLPWKDDSLLPSENLQMAFCRFKGQQRKLDKDTKLAAQYSECFEEWKRMGVIERSSWEEYNNQKTKTIMPHHGVFREDHQTTKCRVVFDGSAVQERSKFPINECLETGPNLIPRLDGILLRIRFGKYIAVGDLAKAFLQLELSEEDSRKMFIFWSDKAEEDLKDSLWKFRRMPWGLNTSPFCLMATLHHHLDHWNANPSLAKKIKRNLYVDDLVMTFDSTSQAKKEIQEAINIFDDAQFQLRKIRTNCEELLQSLEDSERVTLQESKILGTIYEELTDTFCISFSTLIKQAKQAVVTKRIALSMHSSVFDPLGLGNPWHLQAKLLMQETWLEVKGGWNTPLPTDLQGRWKLWASSAEDMKKFKIPRCIASEGDSFQLHYFCDASIKGFAVAVYIQSIENPRKVNLLCSKVKVIPLKMIGKISMPRSELQGAKLAVQVRNMILDSLPKKPTREYFWTDSENVMCWLQKPPEDFKVFVSNRVQFIREHTTASQWSHVPGVDNPADLPTRGCSAQDLLQGKIREKWLHGPEWLKLPKSKWPNNQKFSDTEEVRKELKTSCLLLPAVNTASKLETRFLKATYLDYYKVQNFLLYLLRASWWWKASRKEAKIPQGVRTSEEVIKEKKVWATKQEQDLVQEALVREAQAHYFKDVLQLLQNPKRMETSDDNRAKKLILNLGLSLENGIIYTKGRIHQSDEGFPYGKLILMPGNGPIAWSIMKVFHHQTQHGGSNHALLASREKFWFLRGAKLAVSVKKRCEQCSLLDRKPISVPEATLPAERTMTCAPFEVTGLDFAGPLHGIGPTAKDQEKKYYVLVFTCAVTRAVHFELTAAVDREHFVMGFDNFKSIRGKPKVVYSDNAKTFQSVEQQLSLPLSDWDQIVNGYTDITWKFNVTRAAWWGGFFERVVRMFKDKLKRSFSRQKWQSELHAVSAVKTVEAAINSRPLGHVTMDIDDGRPICPIDFLHYRSPYPMKDELHEKLVSTMNLTQLDNLHRQHISKVKNIWRIFQQGYLQELRKYHFQKPDTTDLLKEGRLVLVKIPGQPRVQWPKGTVTKLRSMEGIRIRKDSHLSELPL